MRSIQNARSLWRVSSSWVASSAVAEATQRWLDRLAFTRLGSLALPPTKVDPTEQEKEKGGCVVRLRREACTDVM